jgi:nitrous oxidase accessory protein NosD
MAYRHRLLLNGTLLVIGMVFLVPRATIGQGQSGTHALTCGPDKTIGEAIKTLKPGDTLLVSGICNENLTIGQEVERITLDGQGAAAIQADSSASAVTILGRGIILRGFHVTGGAPQGVAVNDGGSAVIEGNTIEFADRNGVAVFRNSSADILNNVIQNNPLAGVAVQYNSRTMAPKVSRSIAAPWRRSSRTSSRTMPAMACSSTGMHKPKSVPTPSAAMREMRFER